MRSRPFSAMKISRFGLVFITRVSAGLLIIFVLITTFLLPSVLAKPTSLLPGTITVVVLELCETVDETPNTNCNGLNAGAPRIDTVTQKATLCTLGSTAFGCGRNGYPFSENPVTLNLEDYVTDVVPNDLVQNQETFSGMDKCCS